MEREPNVTAEQDRTQEEKERDLRISNDLLDFIHRSPSCYHAVDNMAATLREQGYEELYESRTWQIAPGGRYFVRRNLSTLLAFRIPEGEVTGFQIGAAHSDSPAFKIKENGEIAVDGAYTELNVEKYGGMLCAPWFDRPLSVAGRVVVQENAAPMELDAVDCGDGGHGTDTDSPQVQPVGVAEGTDSLVTRLVNIDRDLLMIPSLAIHMNRKANDGYSYSIQKDMLPLLGDEKAKGQFKSLVAGAAGVREEEILGMDLFLYCRGRGTIWGADSEYLSSPKLDDLQCAYGLLRGFLAADCGSEAEKGRCDSLQSKSWSSEETVQREYAADESRNGPSSAIPVLAVFDNEEVGSTTRQGAASTVLQDTLLRINEALGGSHADYLCRIASSFMVSADNAHAVHPNHVAAADPTNHPHMNRGIVIKFSANQKYGTDALSAAVFRAVCGKANVPTQVFHNHSDIAGGSTLGNISTSQVSLKMVDIGLPQLAMHSAVETAGVRDTAYLIDAMAQFYACRIEDCGGGIFRLR